jgi:hypothetical protein
LPSRPVRRGSLAAFAREAETFLAAKPWCKRVRRGYYDCGWDGILGVFFFEIEPNGQGVDDSVWVIAGDVPTAYVCNDNTTGMEALESYVKEMQRWVDAARRNESVEDLIPVNTPPTAEYADMLGSRLDFIRRELLSGR